ncbi:hypothetical protein PVAG01_06065 [Phlyctema vagabunda]|uniref:INO80 complex subunit B-like conserved region domain-containing protein n=1 Tax=Phlyctema vagabunda TaxID=108571 RepID=A0ABR4PF00_9HELO
MSRPSRQSVSGAEPTTPMATVSRGPPSSSRSPQSMRLTVKLPAGKLREATRSKKDLFSGGEILEGRRARNVKKSYVLPESESEEEEEEDDDEEMEDIGEDDAEGEDDDQEMDDLSEEDAEGEMDVDLPPPPPSIKISKAPSGKQTIIVKPSGKSDGKTVEQKEQAALSDDDDDDLSSIDSAIADEEEEEEPQEVGEEDAEGEDDDEEIGLEDDEEEENPFGSDDEDTPGLGSRGSTPDVNKMTKRQRAKLEETDSGFLMALPDEVQVKKHLTAEEHAMRRAEMARRRKNLSEKRNEEEKMETINKLLKKQAPKTNARRKEFAGAAAGDGTPESDVIKPNPIFVRWMSSKDGNKIGVPEEWLDGPVGSIFGNSVKATGKLGAGVLVEEVL